MEKLKVASPKKLKKAKTKRKEKLEKLEKERFNANLAQMATSAAPSTDRWAALKNHVQNTMEVKPEFANK